MGLKKYKTTNPATIIALNSQTHRLLLEARDVITGGGITLECATAMTHSNADFTSGFWRTTSAQMPAPMLRKQQQLLHGINIMIAVAIAKPCD